MNKTTIGNFYNSYARDYEVIYKDYLTGSDELIDFIVNSLPLECERIAIVDLGCGVGHQLEAVLSKIRSKGLIDKLCFAIGVDVSAEMISVAKEKNGGAQYIEGDILDPDFIETLGQIITDNSPDFLLLTILGNTIGHVIPDDYPLLIQGLSTLKQKCVNGFLFLEFRDGSLLRKEAPSFELRHDGYHAKEYIFSFYVMSHKEINYPTDVFIFRIIKQGSQTKIVNKRYHTDNIYYVFPDRIQEEFANFGEINRVESVQSALKYGIVWQLRNAPPRSRNGSD